MPQRAYNGAPDTRSSAPNTEDDRGTDLLESLPICAMELEVSGSFRVGAQRTSRVAKANYAALDLFEAPDIDTLRSHLEPQLKQPGFEVCVDSALTPPFQTRECFGLRMVTVSGHDLLLHVTSVRLAGATAAKQHVALFFQDVASFESLRLNFEQCRRQLSDFVRTRDAQIELVRASLLSRDRLAEVLLEARSAHTAQHMRRVAVLSEHIGLRLGFGRPELAQLITAARLHDIGIVQVPIEILARNGSVSSAERRVIEEHPANAQKILTAAGYTDPVVSAVSQHHERVDGSGYPERLIGAEICPAAKVLAVADVVDAMLASRTYRDALKTDTALATLERKSSGFDPEVVEACQSVLRSRRSLTACMADEERAAMCGPVMAGSADRF